MFVTVSVITIITSIQPFFNIVCVLYLRCERQNIDKRRQKRLTLVQCSHNKNRTFYTKHAVSISMLDRVKTTNDRRSRLQYNFQIRAYLFLICTDLFVKLFML